jgi:hypothetical protein
LSQSGNIKSKHDVHEKIHESSENHFDANDLLGLSKFDPSQFFIPGWKGEGLITAHGLTIKSVLNNLTIDATSLFKKLSSSSTVKKQTYDEFLAFCSWSKIDVNIFTQSSDFWFHYQDETSPYQEKIQEFVRIYCFRAVAIYLFRIKFILELSNELNIEITEDILFNPLSFLGRIFRKNSSTELDCESLQINQYSWYRPNQEYKDSVLKIKEAFLNVTITELIKLLSTPKDYQIYSLKNYSHSLSHLSFGLFVNDLLVQFPKWIQAEDQVSQSKISNQKTSLLPKPINTLFDGNHAASMALSHWLAQEANVKVSQWDNLICPDFKGQEFLDGTFLKICQELQFLSFLTRIAIEHKYEVVPFICKIIKEKNVSHAQEAYDQFSFLNMTNIGGETLYNRIVLNLADLPKTNPHHHLVTQIQAQKGSLKKEGALFVLTNQKLFVPSHSDRVDQLLKDFKLIASFNLDELKGKGEIPQYIYVLNRRNETQNSKAIKLLKVKRIEKESCFSFNFKGNLIRFNKFNKIVEEFEAFLKNKKAINTPIFVSEIDEDISFEFHVDAIIEGKLVSSANNKENGQMTHPSFFKNLTKSSVALDTFFHIENIDPMNIQNNKLIASELLGVKFSNNSYSLLLIVNQTNPLGIQIELVPFENLKAKIEEYGTAFYTYFGLTPKHNAINLNVFREYFNSSIGFQIIQMQLSDDGPIKLKGKLKSLLIPSFFAQMQFMPKDYLSHFKLLEKESNEILKLHPNDLNKLFSEIEFNFNNIKSQYPWHLLGLLSMFKLNLMSTMTQIETGKIEECQFSNPMMTEKLISLKTFNIYPKNKDVFVNIDTKMPSELHLPLTSMQVKHEEDNDILILKSNDKNIISLYSNNNMIQFIKFILQNANGAKIADILTALRIPTIEELENVLSNFELVKDNKNTIISKTELMISKLLLEQISSN